MIMSKKKEDDYLVEFKGAKLSKHQANSVGFALIFGFFGIIILLFTPIATNRLVVYCILIAFSVIGYYLGNKIFKKKK